MTKTRILVPFAADGTCFNPTLRFPGTQAYIVGEAGKEREFEKFDDALEHIKMMYTPRWKRPNDQGEWEFVLALIWECLPEKYWGLLQA